MGCAEKRRNEANRKKLRVAVNVNGIRGKSTATRLITAILAEAGYRVVGKTTGTAARMIFWDAEDEQEVVVVPTEYPFQNKYRSSTVLSNAVPMPLFCECMAVRPDYQRVYQHQIINAGLTVITNVLEDHLDEMGPTTDQIAWAFADTIPYNGAVVIPDCEYTEYFKRLPKNAAHAFLLQTIHLFQKSILNSLITGYFRTTARLRLPPPMLSALIAKLLFPQC